MTRTPPPSDWVAYLTMFLVVTATMYGKYLIAKGDQPIGEVLEEDFEKLEHELEDIEHEIEEKLK